MAANSDEVVSRIWKESRVRLRAFIARQINNPDDVDDVMQDVFFKIHQNIDKLNDPAKLYPWVFQTTRNAIVDYYRERKAEFTAVDDDPDAFAIEPYESSTEEEVLSWLELMIDELPAKYRDAVLLADIQGVTQKELSDRLDISLSGAKSRVQRGREKLKEILLDCCQLEFNRSGKIVEYRQQKEECTACSN